MEKVNYLRVTKTHTQIIQHSQTLTPITIAIQILKTIIHLRAIHSQTLIKIS